MVASLPDYVEPIRLAQAGTQIEGTLSTASLPRLTAMVGAQQGRLHARIDFGIDAQEYKYVAANIEVDLTLQCNRCLQPMRVPIVTKVALAIVGTETDAEELPARYEPLIVVDDTVSVKEMVEDELILALPIVPVHAPKDCQAGTTTTGEDIPRENPFAVLASLKDRD